MKRVAVAMLCLLAFSAVTPAGQKLKAAFYDAMRNKLYQQAVALGQEYLRSNPDDEPFRLDDAYALLDAGDTTQAIAAFRRLSTSSDRSIADTSSKQLADLLLTQAYNMSGKGDHAASIALLEEYLSHKPGDDQARLQLAYELNSVGRNDWARAEFALLGHSANPEIATKARAAIANLSPVLAPRGSAFGYASHDNTFPDTFYGTDVRYDLGRSRVTPYVIAHFTGDARSGVAGESQIFDDNAIVFSLGARAALSSRLSAFAEGGESMGLRGRPTFAEMRFGLTYYAEFGVAPGSHTTFGVSAADYSRFTNWISYANLTHDFALSGPVRGVLGANAALDAHRLYYNNYAEGYFGLQLAPARGVTLRIIHAYGFYLGRAIAPPPGYEATRGEMLFGLTFK